MEHDVALAQLGAREVELAAVAARGRRRSLIILLAACVPIPFIAGRLNDDMSAEAMVPFVSLIGAVSYSWSKWMRRPEDSQSIAFAGLHRSQRRVAYRSIRTGRAIDDPVVLTIVDSMHQHVQRTGWTAALAVAGLVAASVALVIAGGGGGDAWSAAGAAVAVGAAVVAAGWWLTRRVGQVLSESGDAS
jgi:hypothetical protein